MPASLTGPTVKIKDTYGQLLHMGGSLTASTAGPVYNGTGTATALSLSQTTAVVGTVKFTGDTITSTSGNISIAADGTSRVTLTRADIVSGTIAALDTPLPVTAGGTGGATQVDARTGLGLGSIATQAASNVAITGGTATGLTTVSATTVSAGNLSMSGNVVASATDTDITLSPAGTGKVRATAPFGYGTGAGNTVTQDTSKSTTVVLDAVCGKITMNNATLNTSTSVSFTFTNSTIEATDVVIVNIATTATANSYLVCVDAVASGSCRIHLRNISGSNLSEALVLNYAVIKAVQS